VEAGFWIGWSLVWCVPPLEVELDEKRIGKDGDLKV
jgi:hypothetical protein